MRLVLWLPRMPPAARCWVLLHTMLESAQKDGAEAGGSEHSAAAALLVQLS